MQPLAATAAKPSEDIDAVLGRFEAWSALRKKTEKTPPKANGLHEGVRELSYEKALESSRSRWQTRTQPSASDESKEEIQIRPEQKPAPAITQDKPAQVAFKDDAIRPDKLSLSTASLPIHGTGPRQKATPQPFGTVLAEALPIDPDPSPELGPLALVWPVSPKNERHVSMSLRVASSEQALIKARAAEAGLSVSAYLRHCALEVEKLRNQVHHALALIDQRSERSLTAGQSSAQRSQNGFFSRLRQLVFGRPPRLTLGA